MDKKPEPKKTTSTAPKVEPVKDDKLLSKKQLDTLLMIGYFGIIVGYGLLLYAKFNHKEHA